MCGGGGVGTLRGNSSVESENTAIVSYPQIHTLLKPTSILT